MSRSSAKQGATSPVAPNSVWSRATILPPPDATEAVVRPVLSLNGTWEFAANPSPEFWGDGDQAGWETIGVPGQPTMQGFEIVPDVEFAYRTEVPIPSDFAGRLIVLQFDGVYSYARLWVNGKFVRDHTGGFTTWDADITGHVTPGERASVTLGVTDRTDDVSFATGYARNQIGGILRDVRILALPRQPLTRFDVETRLDPTYRDAVLRVYLAAMLRDGDAATVRLQLLDPHGTPVPLDADPVEITSEEAEVCLEVPVRSPQLWDAEHPRLYTLQAAEYIGGRKVEVVSRRVGFRQVEVRGDAMLVNGQPIKLRGVNHHHISPTGGRSTSPDLDVQDITLLRAANVNFVRTSHYPPTQALLDAADRLGMFVAVESAVTWTKTQDDPAFKVAYLNQFAEMIARDRSHPSVIMWSLGNESRWGANFALEYQFAKFEDPSRPVVFSDGGIAGEDPRILTDVVSKHYAPFDGPFGGEPSPVLHDEYAPLPASTIDPDEQRRDPNVENWWGESIKALWERIFAEEGALGGAIWAAIDDVFLLPKGPAGYGEWGPLDIWRRERPAYWLTKKAYSPVRIAEVPLESKDEPETLRLRVGNWFDFTNLAELQFTWTAGELSGTLPSPDVPPHTDGEIVIPGSQIAGHEAIDLKVYRTSDPTEDVADLLVDAYRLFLTGPATPGVVQRTAEPAPEVKRDATAITVTGKDFSVVFDARTGLIERAVLDGESVIVGGPYLHLIGSDGSWPLSAWSLEDISTHTEADAAVVDIRGRYGTLGVTFAIRIDGAATLTTTYTVANPPSGSHSEVGVAFVLPDTVERVTWSRKALWSAYPAAHIGRPTGTALMNRPGTTDRYADRPAWPWSLDARQYALFGKGDPGGRGTVDFRAAKQNIYWTSAVLQGKGLRLRAESDGSHSVRMETPAARLALANAATGPCSMQRCLDDTDPSVVYDGTWQQQRNTYSRSGYQSTWSISQNAGDSATLAFTGTSIKWIGNTQFNMGMADVLLDGRLVARDVDLYSPLDDPDGGSPQGGHYQRVLYAADGLARGRHTIKIIVTGKRNADAQGTWVNVDAFAVDGPPAAGILPPEGIAFICDNHLTYPKLGYGNCQLPGLTLQPNYTNSVTVRLTDRDENAAITPTGGRGHSWSSPSR